MIPLIVCLFLLSASQCYGAPGIARNSRIVGGSQAAEGEFPFMVTLLYYGNFLCAGTILNENWVLTSGQCVIGTVLEAMTVHAGSTGYGNETGIVVGVIDRAIYDNFDEWAYTDDVALIKVSRPFTFSPTIQPVSLPSPGQQTAGGTMATIVGWGANATNSYLYGELQKVDAPVWSDADCQETYDWYIYVLRENNICAGAAGKGKCRGDAGGPLLVNGQQVGIASWDGYDCATADSPGVYAEVSYYVDWINQHAV